LQQLSALSGCLAGWLAGLTPKACSLAHATGGIEVRGHTTNVVVEGNTIRNSSVGVHVNTSQATHVYVHGNDEQIQ
jgi:nitrous oxidase accessory protein NosD